MGESPHAPVSGWTGRLTPAADVLVTLAAWTYFTLGYVVFFAPLHLIAAIGFKDREPAFQRVNHVFYRIFFRLVGAITPGLAIEIPADVRAIRGSVIVSNHVSYLDPILLISLYPRQKTIVKPVFFKVPIFGLLLRMSGYISPIQETGNDLSMLALIENLSAYLAGGGNLFVFPEGTRSRDGRIGPFSKGAFKIARKCKAPIRVLVVRGTDRLYQPGRFRFHTCAPNTITLALAGSVEPWAGGRQLPASEISAKVRALMQAAMTGGAARATPEVL